VYIPLGERELAREIEQRGMEKGMEKGIEKMARNLMANGISPDVIAKSAGLPLEKIQSLLN
jgi:predicted transposase/invertase (TIGR01784 family)